MVECDGMDVNMYTENLNTLLTLIKKEANPKKAKILERFFKTGKGEYAEGDRFHGITVPKQRAIAKHFFHLPVTDIEVLLQSQMHEERLIALLILVDQAKKADTKTLKNIAEFYLSHTKNINNWDLVDLSADKILGPYIEKTNSKVLTKLALSNLLWERRIAIISTFHFIKQGKSDLTMNTAIILLHDTHDLIHKAVGWMLREVGKRCSEQVLLDFLDMHAHAMPRTMLRYAIEKLNMEKRQCYLNK